MQLLQQQLPGIAATTATDAIKSAATQNHGCLVVVVVVVVVVV